MGFFRKIRLPVIPWQGNQHIWITFISAVVLGIVFIWILRPPGTLEEAEDHLGREVIAFMEWEGDLYTASRNLGHIEFNRLVEGPLVWTLPPRAAWMLDGTPWRIEDTFDPASVGKANEDGQWMIFGRIRDPRIVSLEYRVGEIWYTAQPVAAPGFIVVLEGDIGPADRVRWLDAGGNIIREQSVPDRAW